MVLSQDAVYANRIFTDLPEAKGKDELKAKAAEMNK